MTTTEILRWISFDDAAAPFSVCGLAWFARERRLRRYPAVPPEPLREAVENLANNPAGANIRFRTNATTVQVHVKLQGPPNMYHMTAVGQCGVDCYLDGRFAGCSVPVPNTSEYTWTIPLGFDGRIHEVILNLPLYQTVEALEIGVNEEAEIAPPTPFAYPGPIVWYGTSITQGGCAARPGMAHTSIVSRRLNCEVVNLGFSGNGIGEPEVARLLATIAEPVLYVIDYIGNADYARTQATFKDIIATLRAAHPATPILAIDRIRFAADLFNADWETERVNCATYLDTTVRELRAAGDANLHFHSMADALGTDWDECTVDCIHPTDLGFSRMAEDLVPVIRKLI